MTLARTPKLRKVAASRFAPAREGDLLRVGRLQFELVIDHAKPAAKKPRVNGIVEAAARTAAATKPNALDDSVSEWLFDNDGGDLNPNAGGKELVGGTETVQMNVADTTVFDLGDTDQTDAAETEKQNEDLSAEGSEDDSSTDADSSKGTKRGKKTYGKLPPIPKFSHNDSTTAADDVLRKFFNRR